MMKLEVESDGRIYQAIGLDDPEREGCTYLEYDGPLDWNAPTPTACLMRVDDAPAWVEGGGLASVKTYVIEAIDTMADQARAKILAKPTNPDEYQFALADAKAYSAAMAIAEPGDVVPVPRGVAGWAHAKRRKGWTAQQAADDILSTAAAWVNAMYFIRDERLEAKELARDATSALEAELVLDSFSGNLAVALQALA